MHFSVPLSLCPLFSNSHLSPLPTRKHTYADGRLCKPLSRAWQVWENLFAVQRISPVSTQTDTYLIHTYTISICPAWSLFWPFGHLLCNTEKGQGEIDRKRMSVREIDGVESESIMSHQLVALACRFGISLLLRPGALVSSEIIAHCLLTVHTHNTNCACIRKSAAYNGADSRAESYIDIYIKRNTT